MLKRSLLLVFILSLLPICVNASRPTLPVILVIGDSLSAGYGLTPTQGWVHLLQLRLNTAGYHYEVVNSSTSGHTSNNGFQPLETGLQRYHPKIVIIALGGNDALRGIPLSTTTHNLARLIKLAQSTKAKVILVGVRIPSNYGENFNTAFQAMYHQLSERFHVTLVPELLRGVDTDETLFQADRLHPTAAAQPQLLDNVWKHLQPLI